MKSARLCTWDTLCQPKYYMSDESGRKELQMIQEEKDLGFLVRSDLKPSTQCVQVTAKARKIIGKLEEISGD